MLFSMLSFEKKTFEAAISNFCFRILFARLLQSAVASNGLSLSKVYKSSNNLTFERDSIQKINDGLRCELDLNFICQESKHLPRTRAWNHQNTFSGALVR